MLNYIRADLRRILRRPSRCVIIILFYAITLGIEFHQAITRNYNSVNLVAAASLLFDTSALILGIVEIQNVLADDFHAKTMQIAIGLGISRPKVVLVKVIDFAVLAVVDSLAMTVLFILGSAVCGIHLLGDQIYLLIVCALGNALYMLIATIFTMIPVFYMQSTGFAILFYLIITIDPIKLPLMAFGTKDIVIDLHLLELPYSIVTSTLTTQLSLRNSVPIPQLIGVILYITIGYGLTVLAFNKRELEF